MQPEATAATPAFAQSLDAKGLNCPLPVLRTKVMLNRMQPGQVLRVEATDPHATIDFQAYCARAGHEILSIDESGGVITLLIRRATAPATI
jgi:tRNA 2-thiouridine synthesizing protein A